MGDRGMNQPTGWIGRHPIWSSLALVLGISALFAAILWNYTDGTWTIVPWLLCWFACINLVTFVTYAWDKRQAIKEGRRVPETTLFVVAALGGSLGAFLAMQALRHKTIKPGFRVMFWLIVAAQVLLLMWIAKEKWFGSST
jgi:uncharacterized membrane protein YsdA (DUF1294 family)